ncbi:MAG: sulfotransferase [Cyanobacteria bacterium P01_F01_bin.116]
MSFATKHGPANYALATDDIDKKIDTRLSLSLKREFLVSKLNTILPASRERRFHAYCLGTPRSGTHSITNMLQQNYAAAHEPHGYYAIYHLLKWTAQKYTYDDIQNLLKWRDKKLSLDLEAAHYLHHVTDILANSFPNAKFILTIRDPLSWLESEINRNYGTRHLPFWRALENYRYGRYGAQFTQQDIALEQLGLYPISSYLSYWKDHNQFVLNAVAKEQLLVLETKKIQSSTDQIADFLNVDVRTISLKKSHADRKKKRFRLTEIVDRDYLNQQLETICADFIDHSLSSFIESSSCYSQ